MTNSTYTVPSTEEVAAGAAEIVREIMAGGAAKHGAHIWFSEETVRHHTDRVARHLMTAMMIRDGNQPIIDDEDTLDHLERAVVRLLFAIHKVKAGHH